MRRPRRRALPQRLCELPFGVIEPPFLQQQIPRAGVCQIVAIGHGECATNTLVINKNTQASPKLQRKIDAWG